MLQSNDIGLSPAQQENLAQELSNIAIKHCPAGATAAEVTKAQCRNLSDLKSAVALVSKAAQFDGTVV
ncbi:MAG: hypothetical protein WEE89_22515 [Gemmatimonadota bacterium]